MSTILRGAGAKHKQIIKGEVAPFQTYQGFGTNMWRELFFLEAFSPWKRIFTEAVAGKNISFSSIPQPPQIINGWPQPKMDLSTKISTQAY